ncbi:MAG: hypothetical protein ACRD3Q_01155 [Terriglobales bacterium]
MTSSSDEVKAGERFDFTIKLDKAPNFEGGALAVAFSATDGRGSANVQSLTKPGETVYHLSVRVPVAAGGVWKLSRLEFSNSAAWVDLPYNNVSFRVIPNLGLVFPSSAEVTVNLSQGQLLRKEARLLQGRIQHLKSTVSEYVRADREGAVPRLLRQNLVESADAVRATQDEFLKLTTSEGQEVSADVFFEDLRRSYGDAISHFGRTNATLKEAAHLVRVSDKRKDGAEPLLSLALRPMEQNELAYKVVADEGSLTFDLDVDSTPEGAAVSYYRKGDPPHPNPDPTRSTIHSLPYALWIIHLEKAGYKAEDREHDPFREPNHVVHVDLQK